MTPHDLKNSVWQLAVQGKLVEQCPDEGTGEELFQQIQSEKNSLIKAGKIKKSKMLPVISDDEKPFDLPDGWCWVRLENLCSLITDGTHKTPSYTTDGVRFLSVKDVSNGYFDLSNTKYISQAEHDVLTQRCKPEQGDVLICRIGTLGKALTVDIDLEFSIFVSLGLIKPIKKELAKYIETVINSGYGFSWIQKVKVGGGTHTFKINLDDLRLFPIPLPPLGEQKRIVAKIEKLQPLIDRYEQAWSKLEEFNKRFPVDMQKAILQMAIQGKLVPQLPEEGTGEELFKKLLPHHKGLKPGKSELNLSSMEFDIPESWAMVELNQLFDFVDYRGKTPTKISQGVFLITASNIRQGFMEYTRKEYISREEYESRQSRGITEKGDLLFTTEAPMGNAALCDLEECSCGQRIITFKEYTAHTVLPTLYMYFILSPAFQQQLLDNCTGTTAKGIKADKLKHFLLPLPPYEEQKRIVAKLEEILPLYERLK